MGTVISNLKARFGVDTSDFKKGLKEGEQATSDFKDAAGSQLEKFASMFGVNMGAVNDTLSTAHKSLGFLRQSLMAAAKGGDVMTISMKVLKWAITATGIGAIVVALGTLIAYFMKAGEGSDKFAKILMQVKSVVNNVIDRLAVFGKGLWEILTGKFKQGWETMTGAFKGMGEEIKEDWKVAGDLANRLDALEDREIALINSLEERRAKAAQLRLQAKEETEDQKKKLELLKEAEKIYKGVYGDQVGIEKERLAIMKEQLRIQSSDPTDEQRREIAEQEAKINQLLRERDELLKGLLRESKTASAAVQEQLELEAKKAMNLDALLITASTAHIQIPDLAPVLNALAVPQKQVTQMFVDVAASVNEAFENMAVGLGEFFGALAAGDAGASDFVKVIGSVFADLAITVGKICIAAALAKMALEKALIGFGGAGLALAAGIGLVAIGTAVKGSMKSAVGAGGGSSAVSTSGTTYDARTGLNAKANPIVIQLTGKLTAEGPDLVHVFNYETTRRKNST